MEFLKISPMLQCYNVTLEVGRIGIGCRLSDYLVYVPLNGTFDPQRYYQGASDEGELTVESGVDVKKEGVYYVDYTVKGTGNSGKSRLIVVVTGS